jgi:hypothetical protein
MTNTLTKDPDSYLLLVKDSVQPFYLDSMLEFDAK